MGVVAKAASFVRAVTSGHCPESEYASRLAICKTCPENRREGDKLYCNGCGCPSWFMAELHNKLRWQNLTCPLGKWGVVSRETQESLANGVIDEATLRRAFRPATEREVEQWQSTIGSPAGVTPGEPTATGVPEPSPPTVTM